MSTSSRNYSKPIVSLKPRFSRLFALFIIGFTLAAASAWLVAFSILWGLPLALAVMALGGYLLWTVVLAKGVQQIQAAVWRHDGKWDLVLKGGDSFSADLLPNTFAMPLLTVLWFRRLRQDGIKGRRYSMILFFDSESAKTLSLLRARITTDLKSSA